MDNEGEGGGEGTQEVVYCRTMGRGQGEGSSGVVGLDFGGEGSVVVWRANG